VRVIEAEQKVLHSHKCDPGSECASKEEQSRNRARTSLLWIGLAMATFAVVAFWIGTQYRPTSPENDAIFRRLLRASIVMAMIGLASAAAWQGFRSNIDSPWYKRSGRSQVMGRLEKKKESARLPLSA
jgi:hypothetical protein